MLPDFIRKMGVVDWIPKKGIVEIPAVYQRDRYIALATQHVALFGLQHDGVEITKYRYKAIVDHLAPGGAYKVDNYGIYREGRSSVGEISKEAALLIERTRQSFFEGMKYAAAGRHLYEISGAIGSYAESFGYGVVRDLCGHGIGTHLHEEPDIPNFKKFRRGIKLKSGMTLAVEPMINIGTPDVLWLDDEWTVITADMSLSAHYENTIIITEGRPEILTLTDSEIAAHIWE